MPALRQTSCRWCTQIGALVDPLLQGHWVDVLSIGIVDSEGTHVLHCGSPRPSDETLYELGSLSKVLTTSTLAVLAHEGVVEFGDVVSAFLPEVGTLQNMTLLSLATHTSGLPPLPTNFQPREPRDPYADYLERHLTEFLVSYESPEGLEAYTYSNLGVGLLGYVLAEHTGTPYERLVKNRITGPLRMKDTTITLDQAQLARFLQGHDADGMPVGPWNFGVLQGAGAWRSTVADMVVFLETNIDPPDTGLGRSLRMAHALRDVSPGVTRALGWLVAPEGWLWHNGETGGGHAFLSFSPESRRGVVVLSNTASRVVDRLGLAIMRFLHGMPHALDIPDTVELPVTSLERYVGRYVFDSETEMLIELHDTRLFARIVGQESLGIYATSPELFYYRAVDAELEFIMQEDGDISGLRLHQGGVTSTAYRASTHVEASHSRQSQIEDGSSEGRP